MPDTEKIDPQIHDPQILAPAGSKDSFLAALAAGADAVYCGLKRYSARMEAQNFTVQELASLTRLAHEKGTQVYITVNTLVTPGELDDIGGLLKYSVACVRVPVELQAPLNSRLYHFYLDLGLPCLSR